MLSRGRRVTRSFVPGVGLLSFQSATRVSGVRLIIGFDHDGGTDEQNPDGVSPDALVMPPAAPKALPASPTIALAPDSAAVSRRFLIASSRALVPLLVAVNPLVALNSVMAPTTRTMR